jgi:hypothetical protein
VGIEYQLKFDAPDCESVASELRCLSSAVESSASHFEFAVDGKTGWSDATLQIESFGAYFCDNCGGPGRAILGEVIARLTSKFGAVTITEL